MPSFTTVYRAVVMIAVGVIGVKAWQLYGPTNEQLKSTVVKIIDMAHAAWNKQKSENADSRLVANPSDSPAPAANVAPGPSSTSPALPPALNATQQASPPAAGVTAVPGSSVPQTPQLIAPASVAPANPAKSPADDRVTALMTKLQQLGASDTKLSPWGSSGNLYRFCCRATPTDSPALAQHFESVAEEPAAAVEQVLAKVEAWRTARQSDSVLR